jgi:photosystem II stability/assembly factor-like uncharacterized protein
MLTLMFGVLTLAAITMTAAPGDFERVREQYRETAKREKHFKRWEWFWERRLTADGDFPRPDILKDAVQHVELWRSKNMERIQAAPTWKEIGPEARTPGSSWYGIGRVNSVDYSRQNANVLFLGSARGGLWKSTNGGNDWSNVDVAGYPTFGVSDVAIAPSDDKIIYVATGDHAQTIPGRASSYPGFAYGVLKSTDGGTTWTPTTLSNTPAEQSVLTRLWVHPTDPNTLIVATYGGLRKSTDGGTTWTTKENGRWFKELVQSANDPNILFATTFDPAGNGAGVQILRSSNTGESWASVSTMTAANRIRLATTSADANVIWAVSSLTANDGLEGVYRSVDKGVTWTKLIVQQNLLGWSATGNDQGGQGSYDLAISVSATNAGNVFVGGVNIWRTSNNANTWLLSAHNDGNGAPYVHADIHHMVYQPTGTKLWAVHDGGIAVSTDNGVSWTDKSRGLKIQQYYGLATSDFSGNLTIAGSQDNATTIYTGTQWRHVIGGDGMKSGIDPNDPTIMYGSIYYGTLYKSTDGGNSFSQMARRSNCGNEQAPWVTAFQIDPKVSNVLYHGRQNVWKSTNQGQSWSRVTLPVTGSVVTSLRVAPSNTNTMYVIYANATVLKTTNAGSNWTEITTLPAGLFYTDIDVDATDANKFWVVAGGFSAGSKVYEVSGTTVKNISTGLPNVPVNCVFFHKGAANRLYVGTDLGVFHKEQAMAAFEPYGTAGPQTVVTEIRYVAPLQKIRVSTFGRGLWEVDAKQCIARTPIVTVTGSTTFCEGDSVTLTADEGYEKYLWTNGDTTRSITLKNNFQSGDYSVSVVDANDCRAASSTRKITINSSPAKPRITQRGADTLRCSAVGVAAFQWYFNEAPIPGQTARELKATQSGSYRVEVANSSNCLTKSDPFEFTLVTSVDEEVVRTGSIVLSPNPVADQLTIGMPGEGMKNIQIISADGRVVATFTTDQLTTQISTSEWASGAYVVRVTAGVATWSRMLIKE